jgi:hypothetical protein
LAASPGPSSPIRSKSTSRRRVASAGRADTGTDCPRANSAGRGGAGVAGTSLQPRAHSGRRFNRPSPVACPTGRRGTRLGDHVPEGAEALQPPLRSVACDQRPVERADGRADRPVRLQPSLVQCLVHPGWKAPRAPPPSTNSRRLPANGRFEAWRDTSKPFSLAVGQPRPRPSPCSLAAGLV